MSTPSKLTYTCLESATALTRPSIVRPSSPAAHRMRLLFGKSPVPKENSNEMALKTPNKQVIPATPKRSLLKRILASATPSEKPRPLSVRTTAKNITMTSFVDYEECIEQLVKSLSAKGILCKTKGFIISCSKVNKYTHQDMLSFNLEICMFNGHCAIQRKRLRGDAWFYKKICEEILRVSNENALESLV